MRARRRVALFMDIRGGYDHGIARGVIRFAKERGSWQLFGHGWTLAEIKDLSRWQGDGVITRGRSREESAELAKLGIPIVDVCGTARTPGIFQVTNDDHETGQFAAEHLLSCGFPHFAFCGADEAEWSARRQAGFVEVLGPAHAKMPAFLRPLPWYERARDESELRAWLKSLPTPCGILAANDTLGVKVTRAAQGLGLKIPAQIAVLGVDNEDVLCELASPALSSIPCNCDRIGFEGAKALDELMSGKKAPEGALRVPPLPIIVRASTDTLAVADPLVAQALRFIRGNTGLSVNVEDVARAVPLSRRSLEQRFRKAVGRTIHDEIRRARLESACRMLSTSDMPVAKIALASGFSSPQRFHAVFTDHVHMAPLQYREKRRGGRQ